MNSKTTTNITELLNIGIQINSRTTNICNIITTNKGNNHN